MWKGTNPTKVMSSDNEKKLFMYSSEISYTNYYNLKQFTNNIVHFSIIVSTTIAVIILFSSYNYLLQ